MRAERADFASHPPPRHLRTASISSKPTSISPFVAFYQIASSLRKWKSGFIYLNSRGTTKSSFILRRSLDQRHPRRTTVQHVVLCLAHLIRVLFRAAPG